MGRRFFLEPSKKKWCQKNRSPPAGRIFLNGGNLIMKKSQPESSKERKREKKRPCASVAGDHRKSDPNHINLYTNFKVSTRRIQRYLPFHRTMLQSPANRRKSSEKPLFFTNFIIVFHSFSELQNPQTSYRWKACHMSFLAI